MQWFLHCTLLSRKLYCNSVCCYCMFSGKITIGKITLLLSGKITIPLVLYVFRKDYYSVCYDCILFQERLLQRLTLFRARN